MSSSVPAVPTVTVPSINAFSVEVVNFALLLDRHDPEIRRLMLAAGHYGLACACSEKGRQSLRSTFEGWDAVCDGLTPEQSRVAVAEFAAEIERVSGEIRRRVLVQPTTRRVPARSVLRLVVNNGPTLARPRARRPRASLRPVAAVSGPEAA